MEEKKMNILEYIESVMQGYGISEEEAYRWYDCIYVEQYED